MNHFLTIEGLTRDDLTGLLDDADEFVDVLHRPIPKVPALRGKTVATMFFEPSTRTKMSFEKAAKALSADTMSFSPGTSSLSKGESLKDTVLTIKAMGTDAMVVRHTATGAPWRIAEWIEQPVLNGGDGAHQHPTQALLDALTIRQHFGTLDGLKIGIVGDIRHSRVARSDTQAFAALGADVTMIAPRTLLPVVPEVFPAAVTGRPFSAWVQRSRNDDFGGSQLWLVEWGRSSSRIRNRREQLPWLDACHRDLALPREVDGR